MLIYADITQRKRAEEAIRLARDAAEKALGDLRTAQDNLRMLSDQTGGLSLVNSNDFNKGFERIVRDNSSYYVLGYYPTNDRRDGRFRTITVRVKRPGLTVRARRGYTAS